MLPVPDWVSHAVFYQIYPQTFCDSDADGVGDLPGIISKLDYLVELGVNAIWLSPFYQSPMRDAGYDVADYCSVHPRYGTLDDARRLFAEAAKRGLRVLIDFVPGHTSIDHPWFQESARQESNRYTNWYVWTRSAWERGGGKFAAGMVHGYGERHGNYLCNFFWSQPALNFGFAQPDEPWQLPVDHPDVLALREEMKNVLRFWLEMGVSGFRVDMAGSITRNDPGGVEARRFWQEAQEAMAAIRPDVFTVAEWSDPASALDGKGLHADFLHWDPSYDDLFRKEDYRVPGHFRTGTGPSFFDLAGQGDIAAFIKVYLTHYEATRGKGYISIPVANHDLSRISIGRTDRELEIVYAFLFTMPGVPFFYYGDEIGMREVDLLGQPTKEGSYPPRGGARTPMQWTDGPNAGFSGALPDALWLPVDPAPDAPSVRAQLGREGSLLERTRALIRLRRTEAALAADADFEVLHAEPFAYPFVSMRTAGERRALVVLNPAQRPFSLTLPARAWGEPAWLAGEGVRCERVGESVQITGEGCGFGVFGV